MFDIGFAELLLIAVVGLLAIGLALGSALSWATVQPIKDGIDVSIVGEGMDMWGMSSVLYPELNPGDIVLANIVVLTLGILPIAGLVISSVSAKEGLVEIVELPDHPFFVAAQFHPEFQSRPTRPHPLFSGLPPRGEDGRRRTPRHSPPIALCFSWIKRGEVS